MSELFEEFPKIPRLRRGCLITEKLDGTNAQVHITDDGLVLAGSRSRYVTPEADNYGFARWVQDHIEDLKLLGPGRHYGEWWGAGIQRRYGLTGGDKRFSLFNVRRWRVPEAVLPPCVGLVPILYEGTFSSEIVDTCLKDLRVNGSKASWGFMNPEGIIVYHDAARAMFKVTLEKDEEHKGTGTTT